MGDSEKTLRININISGTNYPIFVKHEDEEVYRKAAVQLNRYITLYEERYSSSIRNDLQVLAMAAFHSTLEWETLANEQIEDPILAKIKELNNKLERFSTAEISKK